ncbi:MAG: HVO_A0114 family putative DNA-binding protein [Chromatiales bacterium]
MEVEMKRVEVEVLSSKAALKAFAKTWRQARTGRSVTPRIAFGSLAELFSAITEKRLQLIRHVAAHAGLNIRQTALQLKRDYKNVYTDVSALVELGLLTKDNRGRLWAPYDEIVIRAELREAA